MADLAAGLGLVGDHEGPDPAFGVGPEPAAGAQLADQLPVVDGLTAKGAVAQLVNAQERVDVIEDGRVCHP